MRAQLLRQDAAGKTYIQLGDPMIEAENLDDLTEEYLDNCAPENVGFIVFHPKIWAFGQEVLVSQ